jgi:hypothetical protein
MGELKAPKFSFENADLWALSKKWKFYTLFVAKLKNKKTFSIYLLPSINPEKYRCCTLIL